MPMTFDNQVAIITGSGRGLGAAYASLLAERGARVVIHDAGVTLDGSGFDPSVADAMVQRITEKGGVAIPCYENIESREGCLKVVELALRYFGRLDILIHNAGWISYTPLEEMTPALFERIANIQIGAPLWLAQAAPYHEAATLRAYCPHHFRTRNVSGRRASRVERLRLWQNGTAWPDECPRGR